LIDNSVATIKGTGKINNNGSFGYVIVAEDGAGFKKGSDKLRVVIWDKNDGDKIVFDNLIPQTIQGIIKMSTNSVFAKEIEESNEIVPTEYAL
jgi:hypothetical protein